MMMMITRSKGSRAIKNTSSCCIFDRVTNRLSTHLLFYIGIILVVSVQLASPSSNTTLTTNDSDRHNETHDFVLSSLVDGGGPQNLTHLQKFVYTQYTSATPVVQRPPETSDRPILAQTPELIRGRLWPKGLFLDDAHPLVQQMGSSPSSSACSNHTKIFLKEIGNFEPWALQSKFFSSLLS